ncbi:MULTISPECIES: enoyl-CoA hydratase/isomerase family protein [Polaromonas]|uniref:Enoyl-CoA hydratase/isomerase family protein n=1 Tax=Polaromonas aquatica TaxID=332657 RepID=A0ABW1U217_9BURK
MNPGVLQGTSRFRLVDYSVTAHVATICLNRPERRNAMDIEMRRELGEAAQDAVADPGVRAIVLTGSGGHFCAGGDIKDMQAGERLDAAAGRLRMKGAHTGIQAFFETDKPVIAAVDGYAYGGGFGLALIADIVLATPAARFCMSFMKVGLVPDCGALYTLARSVGLHRAKAAMLSARELDAQTGMDWGFVHELVSSADLLPYAQAMAEALAGGSAAAIALTKQALNQSQVTGFAAMLEIEASAQGIAFSSDFHREAIGDFVARRPSRFVWPGVPQAASVSSS